MKKTFKAWPVDEGQHGIRLDIDVERRADLPPCPGMGGWKGDNNGIWWTHVHGPVATNLAQSLLTTRDGWFQYVDVVVDGDRLIEITPAGSI